MTDFLISLLTLSGVMSAVIVLALVFLNSGVKIKSSAVFGIWLIIIIRLAFPVYNLPVLVELDLPRQETETVTHPAVQVGQTPQHNVDYPVISPPALSSDTIIAEAPEPQETEMTYGISDILPAVYLTGVILSIIFSAASYLSYIRRIKLTLALPDDEITLLYRKTAERLGIRRAPKLYLSTIPSSPMLFGFFSPKIIIPDYLSPAEAEYVLIHELMHYTRCDIWIKLFALAVRSMHWFNPLVYTAAERLSRAIEMRCDDCVISALSDGQDQRRVEYSSVMLSVLRRSVEIGSELTSNFEPRKSAVSARFENILDSTKKKRGVIPMMLAVLLCAAAGSIFGCTETDLIDSGRDESTSAESSSNEVIGTIADEQQTNPELDGMISEIDESTVTVLNSSAYEKRLTDGFMELDENDVKYIISSSIDLYFKYETIVLPDIMEFFAEYPTVEKEIYIDGEMQKVQIPDTLMTNILYYLIDGYTINTIHDINDDEAVISYCGYTDINGDGEIDGQEKAQAPSFSRESYHHAMLYQIRSIITYRLIALSDPDCFSESSVSYIYSPAGADKNTFFELDRKGSADASIIFVTVSGSIKLFPTDEIEYENMLLDSLSEAERKWQEKYLTALQYENELNAELEYYLAELREQKTSEEQLENEMSALKEEQLLLEEMLENEMTAMMAEAEEKSIAARWNWISSIEQDINEVYAQFVETQDSYFVTQSMISNTEQQISEIRQLLSEIEN